MAYQKVYLFNKRSGEQRKRSHREQSNVPNKLLLQLSNLHVHIFAQSYERALFVPRIDKARNILQVAMNDSQIVYLIVKEE